MTPWNFDNSFSKLPSTLFTAIKPQISPKAQLMLFNESLAKELNLHFDNLETNRLAQEFSGSILPDEAFPIALAYAGHQFGYFTSLGDGRAHLLGEHLTPQGTRFDIQLKGSGITPYSRSGDGKAAFAPMLREYLISESMHSLGIPTTRSLAVVLTGEKVHREQPLDAAILTRIASSHIRFGTFEYLSAHNDIKTLKQLADYTIKRHYPTLIDKDNRYLAFITAVMDNLITLIIHWLRVGFVHGVMNTDNMSIAGETLDYGPCSFMDEYDPLFSLSSIDTHKRYAFANQAPILQWNLCRFAETLLPLISPDSSQATSLATEVIEQYEDRFTQAWLNMMKQKIGLHPSDPEKPVIDLVSELLRWMQENKADYTNTFQNIMLPIDQRPPLYQKESFEQWHQKWQAQQIASCNTLKQSIQIMEKNNPAIIPRNHLVDSALTQWAEQNNAEPFQNLFKALQTPYAKPAPPQFTNLPQEHERVKATFCGT